MAERLIKTAIYVYDTRVTSGVMTARDAAITLLKNAAPNTDDIPIGAVPMTHIIYFSGKIRQ